MFASETAIAQIDVDELARRLGSGVQLIDVREADEFADARVPGAMLLPLSEWPAAADRLPPDGVLHLICARGSRSQTAAEFLAKAHDREVVNIAGGTVAWIDRGYNTETGRTPVRER